MSAQDTENLFRRFKGESITLKTVSGGVYTGRISEVSNDWVCLIEQQDAETARVFLFFTALESIIVNEDTPA